MIFVVARLFCGWIVSNLNGRKHGATTNILTKLCGTAKKKFKTSKKTFRNTTQFTIVKVELSRKKQKNKKKFF